MFLTSSLLYALLATAASGSEHLRQLKSTKAGKSNKAGNLRPKAGKSVWSKAGGKKKAKQQCKRPKRAKLPEQCKSEAKLPTPALPVPNIGSEKNVMTCALALGASGFDFFDLPNYDKWFNDESVMHLAVTGTYQGAANIAEYVSFLVNATDVWTYEPVPVDVDYPPFLPIVANDNYCIITTAGVSSTNTTAGAITADTVVGARLQYTILEDEQSILIDHAEIVSFYDINTSFSFVTLLTFTFSRLFACFLKTVLPQKLHETHFWRSLAH